MSAYRTKKSAPAVAGTTPAPTVDKKEEPKKTEAKASASAAPASDPQKRVCILDCLCCSKYDASYNTCRGDY